jgi:hypothetical protein
MRAARRMRLPSLALALTLVAGCATSSPRAPAPAARAFHMRTWWLVLLQRASHWSPDETPETGRLFEARVRSYCRSQQFNCAQ